MIVTPQEFRKCVEPFVIGPLGVDVWSLGLDDLVEGLGLPFDLWVMGQGALEADAGVLGPLWKLDWGLCILWRPRGANSMRQN